MNARRFTQDLYLELHIELSEAELHYEKNKSNQMRCISCLDLVYKMKFLGLQFYPVLF